MARSSRAGSYLAKALVLSKLLGMLPMTGDFNLSKIGLLRAAICFSITLFTAFKTLSFLGVTTYRWTLSKYLDFLELGLLMFSIFFCLVLSLKMGRRLRCVAGKLDSIDCTLDSMNKRVTYRAYYNNCHSFIRIVFVLAMAAEQFILPYFADSWWDNLFYVLTLFLGFLILHLFLSPFYALLHALNVHFVAIRELLEDLNVQVDRGWRQKVERLVHLHIELYHSCCIVNRMYSIMAFVVVSAAFIIIVKNIYFICYIMIEYRTMIWKKIYHLAICVTYILMWALEISTIAFFCARLTSQSIEFNDAVYEVLLNDPSDVLQCSGKLKLQLAYKPVAAFKACEFLSLDFTLVNSMAATATTYIVLLIQLGSGKEFKISQ